MGTDAIYIYFTCGLITNRFKLMVIPANAAIPFFAKLVAWRGLSSMALLYLNYEVSVSVKTMN